MREMILQLLSRFDPSCEFLTLSAGNSSCVLMTSPKGFKDLPGAALCGFFEYGTNESLSELLGLVIQSAKARGASRVVGPLDFSTILDYRLQLNDFDRPRFLGEPKNEARVVQVFEACGYHSIAQYDTRWIDCDQGFQDLKKELKKIAASSTLSLSFERVTQESLMNSANEIYALSEEIFSDNYAYRSIPFEMFYQGFSKSTVPHTCLESSFFVSVEGERIGFVLNLKDPGFPDRLLLKTIGVKPKFRQMGLTFLRMLDHVFDVASEKKAMGFCLMKKGNVPDFFSKGLKSTLTEYALFEKHV